MKRKREEKASPEPKKRNVTISQCTRQGALAQTLSPFLIPPLAAIVLNYAFGTPIDGKEISSRHMPDHDAVIKWICIEDQTIIGKMRDCNVKMMDWNTLVMSDIIFSVKSSLRLISVSNGIVAQQTRDHNILLSRLETGEIIHEKKMNEAVGFLWFRWHRDEYFLFSDTGKISAYRASDHGLLWTEDVGFGDNFDEQRYTMSADEIVICTSEFSFTILDVITRERNCYIDIEDLMTFETDDIYQHAMALWGDELYVLLKFRDDQHRKVFGYTEIAVFNIHGATKMQRHWTVDDDAEHIYITHDGVLVVLSDVLITMFS